MKEPNTPEKCIEGGVGIPSIKNDDPYVVIVLLNWNGWRDTMQCLQSLDRLTYSRFRTLVVDNGSIDGSVDELRSRFPNLRIHLNHSNCGFAAGCNVGIRISMEAGADYVWLLNNDTVVAENALRAMVDTAAKDDRIGAVGSVLRYLDDQKQVQAWGGGYVSIVRGIARHHRHPVDSDSLHYINGASLLLRTDALRSVGLLDEVFFLYWEDTDLCYRLRRKGWKLAVADASSVFHKESGSVGAGSDSFHTYFNDSATTFFRRYSQVPCWSILSGTFRRTLRLFLSGNWRRVPAVFRGIRNALRRRCPRAITRVDRS